MEIDSPSIQTELLVSGNTELSGSTNITGDILPTITDQFDIGSDTLRFKDLYLSGSTIFLGNVKLSEGEDGGLKVVSANETEIIVGEVDTEEIDNRLDNLETESGSIRTELNNYTSSTDNRLDSLETESGSIRTDFNNFTSSIDSALTINNEDVVAKGDLTITGDLLVQGTQSIFNTEVLSVESNIIELNTAGAVKGGILVGDVTAPSELSGSLLWDGTNDYWIAGISGSEERIVLEDEFTDYTSSTDSRISSLETESGSIRTDFNNFAGSYSTGSFSGSLEGTASFAETASYVSFDDTNNILANQIFG
jgi:hypothetical protein